ncbi:glutamate 5-kinase [Algoriphagus machipongonensis]|uniref:Glutamate 5-kinase n=1 Tax=Algoriphagus machipongonensis TaxID=388413 RepID=A3HYZ2_9BACT|nr:glutamate 5-kinase [Algoriphagus machipongonensis]EAZ80478.1 glutamate 5-kinase [Algoriphagus machipongonensis]
MLDSKLLVIKIGSNVLTQENGFPDLLRMEKLVSQISRLIAAGKKVVLVSSGAVAFGRKAIPLPDKLNPVLKKQIWASTGQIRIINHYQKLFEKQQLEIAQVLVTKEDFRDRKHFLNMKNCVQALLSQGILPIINENDTVTITELMFTDNDELAGLTAAMINADTLLLLTNVDGIYTGNPADPASKLIEKVASKMPEVSNYISASKSSFGRGGMLTKYAMAKKSADLGIQVVIANGNKENVLDHFANKTLECTWFEPKKAKQGVKKWLAHGTEYYKGEIIVNEGAKNSLHSEVIRSLLPIGILSLNGEFVKGDILLIKDEKGHKVGLGRAEYSSKLAKERIGQKNQKALIHYDYLYIFDHD